MRVIFAPSARADLLAIGDFIRKDNPVRADTFVEELHLACMQLAETQKAYPLRPDLGANFRARFYRRYAIVYRIDPRHVSIIGVLHGARDLRALILDRELEQ